MTDPIVLVHSPLVGPATWQPVAETLRHAGHQVVVPSLLDAIVAPYHRNLATAAAGGVTGPVVVVGHSGAGVLLPAIAETLDVRAAVFVDAVLPHPGTSWLATVSEELRAQGAGLVHDGRLAPWHTWFPAEMLDRLLPDPEIRARIVAEIPSVPAAYLGEPAPETQLSPAVRCAYVRLSDAYDDEVAEAERHGWWVRRVDMDHLAIVTRPDRIAALIIEACTS
jgi:hypothetical protein